ncbi:ddb1 and cul4 associated factor 7 [Nowakowskiella sp. JEL0407]|nr:ddb1 and cul4 associated factor 7 [Nowakowskiella sp. JEL0407]KAJ3128014.1 ddb1 and cul4 associated factor 7 [Nowakowskiella sp. JEL0407]
MSHRRNISIGNVSSTGGTTGNEVYTYSAPWPVYALHWSQLPGSFRFAFGSFFEEYANKVRVVQLSENGQELVDVTELDHQYPVTKVLWSPYKGGLTPDLMATTGDYLRIWELCQVDTNPYDATDMESTLESQFVLKATLANVRKPGHSGNKREYCAPLTSFDWNETDPSFVVTASIDTTCTVWDVTTQQAKTQLIAHDKEVYDVAFAKGTDIFASVGGDGSVRMFDLRALEHSTIIYETTNQSVNSNGTSENTPLLRVSWNKQDPNYIATFGMDSNSILILDVRVPAIPVTELTGHVGSVNAISWAPHSRDHLCSVGEDKQTLVWDIAQASRNKANSSGAEPILMYSSPAETNSISWTPNHPDWVGIAWGSTVQALRL